MKRAILFHAVFCISISFSKAQIIGDSVEITINQPKSSHLFELRDKRIVSYIHFSDSAHFIIYDSNLKKEVDFQFKYSKNHNGLKVQHYYQEENLFKVILGNGKGQFAPYLTINMDTRSFSFGQEKKKFKLKNERFIASFIYNKIVHIAAVEKGTSILNIHKSADGVNFKKISKDFKTLPFRDRMPNSLFEAILKEKIYRLQETDPQYLQNVVTQNKIYYQDEKLFITFDFNNDGTVLLSYSPENDDFNYNKFFYPSITTKDDYFSSSNSFLTGNRLYQFSAEKEIFHFKISDIRDKRALAEFQIDLDKSKRLTHHMGYNRKMNTSLFFPLRKRDQADIAEEMDVTAEKLRKLFNKTGERQAAVLGERSRLGATSITFGHFEEENWSLPSSDPVSPLSSGAVFSVVRSSSATMYLDEELIPIDNQIKQSIGVLNVLDSYRITNPNRVSIESFLIDDSSIIYGYQNKKNNYFKIVKFDLNELKN